MQTWRTKSPTAPNGIDGMDDKYEQAPRQKMETIAKAASFICAAGAGVGVATGLMSFEDGFLTGIFVPVAMGGSVAGANACGWHMLHTAATRVRTPLAYVAVLGTALTLSMATIGASSWAIATTLSGHAAVRQNKSMAVVTYQQALDAAWQQTRGEGAMVDAALTGAAELRAMSTIESHGFISHHGNGLGPNSNVLAAGADGYDRLAGVMREGEEEARKIYEKGQQALGKMRAAVHSDGTEFEHAAGVVAAAVSDLDAFRLTDLANKAGLVQVEAWSVGGTVAAIRSGAERVSEKVIERGREIAQARQVVPVPVYTPMEPREATWKYATGAAMAGWITGIALDLLPFVFACLLLGTHAVGLLDKKPKTSGSSTHDGNDEPTETGQATRLIWPRPIQTS